MIRFYSLIFAKHSNTYPFERIAWTTWKLLLYGKRALFSNYLKIVAIRGGANSEPWASYNFRLALKKHFGNFRHFLPLSFYVKSILVEFRVSKTFILRISAALIFVFLGNCWHFQIWHFAKNQNSEPRRVSKLQFLTFWNH